MIQPIQAGRDRYRRKATEETWNYNIGGLLDEVHPPIAANGP